MFVSEEYYLNNIDELQKELRRNKLHNKAMKVKILFFNLLQ